MELQQLNEVCRRTGLEPVPTVSLLRESVEYAERVVQPDGVLAEMVSVVVLLQLCAGLVVALSVCGGKFKDIIMEVVCKLLLGDAADVDVPVVPGNRPPMC